MIQKFLFNCANDQNPKVQAFGVYFGGYFAPRAEEWALCLRGLEALTNNMILEAFHKKLKRNPAYMDGHHNKQVGPLLVHIQANEGETMIRHYKSKHGRSNRN